MTQVRRRLVAVASGLGIAAGLFAVAPPLTASAQVTVTGSSTQITNSTVGDFDPAISGNFAAYTCNGAQGSNVCYTDITTKIERQVTTAGASDSYYLADISGTTIVFVHQTSSPSVQGYVIGGSTFNIAANPTVSTTEPAIGGSLVAWEDNRNGTYNIYAATVVGGVVSGETALTTSTTNNSHTPNVSGDLVAYSTQDAATSLSQIFVSSYSGVTATQQVTTLGSNTQPDISGNRVVYQSVRNGFQHVYVFDLTTHVETPITTTGLQRNPHISGDWVSYEDVSSIGLSSIMLYYIPTGQTFTAVAGAAPFGAFLNDIDGHTIAYTAGDANSIEQIYVYQFTFSSATPTVSDLSTLVGQLVSAGCIDNAGIGNALTAKLAAAQSAINAGDLKTAINILTAFINQVQAQTGKHISTSCGVNGATDATAMLITDAQGIIDSLKVSADPNPITGSFVTSVGSAVAGATVSLVDATGTTLAAATSDVTGFFFFATTGLLTPGGSYAVTVTGLPSGFASSSPSSQPFTWAGNALPLSGFTLS